MSRPEDVPEPSLWWEDAPDPGVRVVGSREDGVLACQNEDGRFHGPMTIFSADGEHPPLIECTWKDGELDGPQTVWRPPFYRCGEFREGVPTGQWSLYWKSHRLVWVDYENGVPVAAGRENELTIDTSSKPVFIANDVKHESLEDAIRDGDEVQKLVISGWTEPALPPEVWELANLELLQIFYSEIRPIPADIAKLENLKVLHIEGCNIGWVDPAIADLEHLTHLNIVDSGLGVFPKVANPNLKAMDLNGNIMVRVAHSLADCPDLAILKMRDNYIFTLEEDVFAAPSLRMIDMAGSFWLSWISPAVADAETLVNLNLYEQCLLTLPDELADCEQLQSLNLYGSHLVDAPWALGKRAIGQLNLDGTPLHALPGLDDFEEQLRAKWAEVDTAVAEQVAVEALSVDSLGLDPPDEMHAFSRASRARGDVWPSGYASDSESETDDGWRASSDDSEWAELASQLTSNDFGCEHGGSPVDALVGPARTVDVPTTELLLHLGVLRPATKDEFSDLALQNSGSQLVEALEAIAPVEAWMLEVVAEEPFDIKLAFLVAQIDEAIWVAIGPRAHDHSIFSPNLDYPTFEPRDGQLRQMLTRDIQRHGGGRLWYQRLEREPGEETLVVFEETRHRVVEKYLASANVLTNDVLDEAAFSGRSEALDRVGTLIADLENPRRIVCGGLSLHHLLWTGQDDDGQVVGLHTEVVRT